MKKILLSAAIVSPLLCLAQGMDVHAAAQKLVTQESSPITTNSTNSVTVTVTKGSTFSVVIPKTIQVDDSAESSYEVRIRGDIAGNEQVTVVPDANFILKQDGKQDFTGTTNQVVTSARHNEITSTSDKVINGKVIATGITAGVWNGTFNFKINLN